MFSFRYGIFRFSLKNQNKKVKHFRSGTKDKHTGRHWPVTSGAEFRPPRRPAVEMPGGEARNVVPTPRSVTVQPHCATVQIKGHGSDLVLHPRQ